MPATLVGAISGMLVGMFISLEIKFLAGLRKVRVIFWQFVGLTTLATLLLKAFEYRWWLLNWNNASAILMVTMYFGGLIWVGWRLYRSSSLEPTRSLQVPSANHENNGHLSGYLLVINIFCVVMGLVLIVYSISIIAEFIQYPFEITALFWQVVILVGGICSIVGLRTMHKWGV
jgi:hypothetical protein